MRIHNRVFVCTFAYYFMLTLFFYCDFVIFFFNLMSDASQALYKLQNRFTKVQRSIH